MESRVKKYNIETSEQISSNQTRSSRNTRLYRQVYGKYGDLDNLPLEDNTDEIDMNRLKELLSSTNSVRKNEEQELKKSLNILEQRKRQIDEQKIYDINKILEKAKYENNKLKEPVQPLNKINKDLLSTLESSVISVPSFKDEKEMYQTQQIQLEHEKEEQLAMTREIKYQNLEQAVSENSLLEHVMPDSDLSLDLFQDLKPTENTITTKPIKESVKATTFSDKNDDFRSEDTKDIDIIKNDSNIVKDDFFTSSYEFSKKDFAGLDDEFYDERKHGGILKILLLILAIFIFVGVIVYFVQTYGIGT